MGLFLGLKFNQYFNGSICNFMNFFEHGINGDGKTGETRWAGTNEISDTLISMKTTIDTIGNSNFNQTQQYSDSINDFYDNIANLIIQKIENPNNSTLDFSPLPMLEFFCEGMDSCTDKTYLGRLILAINNDYSNYTALNLICDTISQNSGTLKDNLDSSSTTVDGMTDIFESAKEKILTDFVDIQENVSDYMLLAFHILFGIYIGISAIIILIITFYICMSCCLGKCWIHFIWNLLIFFSIITFIISGLWGILGIIGSEVTPIVNYILSEDQLKSEDSFWSTSEEITKLVTTCTNGDGNLFKSLNLELSDEEGGIESMIKILDIARNAKKSGSKLSTTPYEEIEEAQKYLDSILNDWSKATDSTFGDSDYSIILEKINNNFNSPTKWSLVKNDSSYILNYNASELSDPLKTNIENLQNSIKSLETKIEFVKNNLTILYDNIIESGNVAYSEISSLIDEIINFFNTWVGETGSWEDMLNCKFVATDLISFFDMFHTKFSKTSTLISYVVFLISLFGIIAIIFWVSTMNNFVKKWKDKEENAPGDDWTNQINLEEVPINHQNELEKMMELPKIMN